MNRVERMKNSWSFFAFSAKREYAQAAGMPNSVAIIVDAVATMIEFLNDTARFDAPPEPRLTKASL